MFFRRQPIKRIFLLLVFAFPIYANADELVQLRAEYASNFLNPETHLRLAKFLMDKGDRLNAFYISEAARRTYFGNASFDPAFRAVFRNDHFDNSVEAEKRLRESLEASPEDAKKRAQLADVFLSRSQWEKAESEIRIAAKLMPDSYAYVDVLGEILRRAGREVEAEATLNEWFAKHTQSLESLQARVHALGASNSTNAQAEADTALAAYPDDAYLHLLRAGLFETDKNIESAAKEYVRAAELDNKSARIHGWTAHFFLKTMKDPARALQYYLNAYFIDPHFYDFEYAESRIPGVASWLARSRYTKARRSGESIVKLLEDTDPMIVGLALAEADKEWTSEMASAVIAILGNDGPTRYSAAEVLGHHLRADDERIDRLLQDADLRVRSSSAYIAGALRGDMIVPLMASWLDHPADLIRYDAISVLATTAKQSGYELLMKVRAAGTVKEPRLRVMLDSVAHKNSKISSQVINP